LAAKAASNALKGYKMLRRSLPKTRTTVGFAARVEVDGKDLAVSPSRTGGRISLQFPFDLFLKAGQTLNIAIN